MTAAITGASRSSLTKYGLPAGIGFAAVIAAVMSNAPSWWLVAGAGLCALLTASLRGGSVVAALTLAAAVGLPWPAPCFAAGAVWYAWRGSDRTLFTTRSPVTLRTVLVVGVVGTIAAGIAAIVQLRPGGPGPFFVGVMQPSPIVLVLVVLGMAAVNAFGEELLWRGVLANSVPSRAIAFGYALQAITFGLAHFHGIPAGMWGIAISAVYSAVIFLFSRRYGPRFALATHLVTDVVLFAIMASTATFAFASLQ